ncbi:hypothetical protein [Agromyces sp. ZXT2-3]|uniref:hypothetical protein n=1 Tax=Agromyces sp. ZXT2-3 TaxID=3461152 RepID=UPI004054D01B
MRSNAAVRTAAAILTVLLTGCASTGADRSVTPPTTSPTPSVLPAASGPLDCADLAPGDLVAAALQGSAPEPVAPVSAVQPEAVFESVLLEGVGGLSCSWRVGSGMPVYDDPSDWAYLRIAVLPDGAAEWVPLESHEGGAVPTRRVGEVDASFLGGESGWVFSAPVGKHWVLVDVRAAGLTAWGGRYRGVDIEVVIDRLAEVAAAAYASVAAAPADGFGPPLVAVGETPAECRGGLAAPGILAAAEAPPGAEVVAFSREEPAASFEEAVALRAGTFTCAIVVDGFPETIIRTARGFGELVDRFDAPDAGVAFGRIEPEGVPEGHTVTAYVEDAGDEPVGRLAALSAGDSLYWIDGARAGAIARAIVAQTY